MRRDFAEYLFEELKVNKDLFLITGDLGFNLFNKHIETFPERVLNPGSSEQLIMGMATGLALENKIPVVYSITPFIIYRPFEFIRNYLDHEKIPVKIVGGGRDYDYGSEGFTHHAPEDIKILENFKNIELLKPSIFNRDLFNSFINSPNPAYLNLIR